MSESMAAQNADQAGHGAPGEPTGMSAGVLLRQSREAAGVHIDVLAGVLKVPVAKLQALEADHYEAFPDAVFMRGLASGMCRALKVDAAPVLALLPQGSPIHLPPERGINASFKDSGRRQGKGGSIERPKSRLVGVAVVALLLAALVLAFLPMGNEGKDERAAVAPAPAQTSHAAPEAPDAAAAQAGPTADPVVQAAPVQAPGAPMAAEPPVASVAPGTAVPDAAKAVASEDVLRISARAQSWVQVRDTAGRVVLQKVLAAGESFSAEGSPPWSVVIGRADATDVIVRGQPMDLKAIARENVARFEVK